MRVLRRIGIGAIFFWVCTAARATVVFSYPDFSSCVGLQINGDAACMAGVLRLTPASIGQSGSTFSTAQVPLGAGAEFSTFFSFRMSAVGGIGDGDGTGADGIVFVVQPIASTVGGGGGGIGYQGIPASLGIEFDTYDNGSGAGDPDGNHVGVDLNGSVFSIQTVPIATRMNDGNVWFAWIDYDGTTLELRLNQTNVRPATPTLSTVVTLPAVLGTTQAFVGFTAGTGSGFENQDILSWEFNNAFAPIGAPAAARQIPALSTLALALVGLLLVIAAGIAVRKRPA